MPLLLLTHLLLFGLLKLWRTTATAGDLTFLLTPTDRIVGWATADPGHWVTGEGYYHAGARILIDASCAGFNFFLIAFLVVGWALHHRRSGRASTAGRWYRLPSHLATALGVAWLATVVANAARILTILTVGAGLPAAARLPGAHALQGGFVYLFCLTTLYLALTYRTPQTLHP